MENQKKALFLLGSSRRGGNSDLMAEYLRNNLVKKGFLTQEIIATLLDIKQCMGCNSCFKNDEACIYHDDFNSVAKAIESSDLLVFAFPLYRYSYPMKMKAIIDKFYSFYVKGNGFKGKEVILLSCCEDSDIKSFTPLWEIFDKSMELLEAEKVYKILIPGVSIYKEIENTSYRKKIDSLIKKLSI
jgi:hypothetical protein